MPAERITMRKVKEVLRLKFDAELSNRQIAQSCSMGHSTVGEYIRRFRQASLSWPLPEDIDDNHLEQLLFPQPQLGSSHIRPVPDCAYIHRELRRKGVTLMLLWQEYKQQHPQGYQYSQFCDLYRRWTKTIDAVMRQHHVAGEKMFVDFSGDGIPIVDRETGVVTEAQLFVAVLGASSYTYVEAFPSQELRWWIEGHIHAFEYFGGVTQAVVPDNTKTGVTKACYYEPDLNPTYNDLAKHYGTAILPARPRKPRDKAKVENGVLIAQRWIIARLRNHSFHSLEEINEAVPECLEDINDRKMREFGRSRRELYLDLDRPNLKPLP